MYNKSKILAFVSPFLVLVGGASLFIYHTISSFNVANKQLILNFLLFLMISGPVTITVTLILGMDYWNRQNAILHAFSMMWTIMITYLTILSILMWSIFVISKFTGIEFDMTSVWFFGILTIYTIVLSGLHRAAHPKIKEVKINAPRLAPFWKGKNIVLISDVHIGMIRRENFIGKLVEKINTINPDIVFIAGDLIDGPRFPYDIFLAPFGKIKSKLGIYYTPGNHELYNNQNDLLYASLPSNITVLRDSSITIEGTQIIGIDFGRENKEKTIERFEKFSYKKDRPSIALFHDPRNVGALVEKGIDLVLSGHTHGGQFFPKTILTKIKYGKQNSGLSRIQNTLIYVSVGVGTALAPVRIGTTPEIAVLKIV